jgi:hypothetical protein
LAFRRATGVAQPANAISPQIAAVKHHKRIVV